jgi:cytochrome c oxidase subunit 4
MTEGTDVVDTEGTDLVPAPEGGAVAETVDQTPGTLDEHHGHPGPRQYVMIAVVLVIATAIEVGLYYLEGDVNSNLLIAMLAVLAVVKFFLVCAWYMHMQVDAPFFRRIFVVGLLGAIVVYGAVLLTFVSTVLAD